MAPIISVRECTNQANGVPVSHHMTGFSINVINFVPIRACGLCSCGGLYAYNAPRGQFTH